MNRLRDLLSDFSKVGRGQMVILILVWLGGMLMGTLFPEGMPGGEMVVEEGRPTFTPRPGRASPTPGIVTTTPEVTASPTLGIVTATPEATATPVAGGCPPHLNAWHAPKDEPCMHHHHGDNPRLYADVFDDGGFDLHAWLDAYGELYQPAWLSSPTEDVRGMIWMYVHTDDCEAGGLDISGYAGCVTDVLLRLHDVGDAGHMVNRFHSASAIIRSCHQLPGGVYGNLCGVMAMGMLQDYGIFETPYKQAHCPLANDPPGFYDLGNFPYRTMQTEDRGDLVQFWNAFRVNAVNKEFYPHEPNALVGTAWSSTDAYQVWDTAAGCGLASLETAKAAAVEMPVTKYDHSNFSLWAVLVYGIPGTPFEGFTDQWGHVMPAGECEAVSSTCIPLIITGYFPATAVYNVPVDNTGPGANEYFSPFLLPPWEEGAEE